MKEENVHLTSQGQKLDASYYWADESNQGPMVVVLSGFHGLKNIHPERFSRFITQRGYDCFGFDYRGFGLSEGDRRQTTLEGEVQDIQAVVDFISRSQGRKVILLGWGMAGGLIMKMAASREDKISGLIPVNGFYNGARVQQKVRGHEGYEKFIKWYEDNKDSQEDFEPFDIYPLDSVTREYVDNVLYKNPDFGGKMKMSFATSLINFVVEYKETNIPMLAVHGESNALHPPGEAKDLVDNYHGHKEIYWVPKAGHTEWMLDENHKFQRVVEEIDQWIQRNAHD